MNAAEMAPGTYVAVRHGCGAWWTPGIFRCIDDRGLMLLDPVAETQPSTVAIPISGPQAIPWTLAAGVVFTFACMLCKQTGDIERWIRTKYAGPMDDERPGVVVNPNQIVDCPVCEGEGIVTYDPFKLPHGCAKPPWQPNVRVAA